MSGGLADLDGRRGAFGVKFPWKVFVDIGVESELNEYRGNVFGLMDDRRGVGALCGAAVSGDLAEELV